MNVKVRDLMVDQVMTLTPHQTVGHAKQLMREHGVHFFPVVDPERHAIGVLSSSDLLDDTPDGAPITRVMTRTVYTVPEYADPSVAARIMRNHHIHHVVVTHEKQVVGVLSTYDLLRLVEDHRYVAKQPPGARRVPPVRT